MNPSARPVSRRSALGALALLPLFAGCSGSLSDQVDRLRAPVSTPPAPPNPDRPLVAAVVTATEELRATLASYADRQPVIADLVALHTAHLRALSATPPAGTPVALDSAHLLADVRGHEAALAALVTKKAVAAHDPALARLLASMAAAIGQRVAGDLA